LRRIFGDERFASVSPISSVRLREVIFRNHLRWAGAPFGAVRAVAVGLAWDTASRNGVWGGEIVAWLSGSLRQGTALSPRDEVEQGWAPKSFWPGYSRGTAKVGQPPV